MSNDLKAHLESLRIDRTAPPPRRRLGGALVAVLAGALVAVGGFSLRGSPVEVATTRATLADASGPAPEGTPLLTASGYVVARRKAVVSAKIQGRLAELRVEEASRVKQGDLIARLEDAEFEAALRRAMASLQRAEAELGEADRQLRRNERLAAEGVVSVDDLEAARSRRRILQAELGQAKADIEVSQAALANTRILAPFSGTVVKKMAEVGESVAPIPPGVNISTASGAIVALADLDTLEVEADVSESNVARLGAEQPATVTVEAFPETTYKAVLRQIIPSADRTKATVQVKVTILDKDERLRPEMSAKATFLERGGAARAGAPTRRIVTVPQEAVVTRDGGSVVFEVRDGKAAVRKVKTLPAREGHVEVTEGLAGSETLVLRPPDALKDGQRVKVAG